MMAHVPLRGMVKKRVLDLFAAMYAPGGGQLDLGGEAAGAGQGGHDGPARASWLDRLALRYVGWKSRRR
jgi:sphinganine-1-phosphate aldolase